MTDDAAESVGPGDVAALALPAFHQRTRSTGRGAPRRRRRCRGTRIVVRPACVACTRRRRREHVAGTAEPERAGDGGSPVPSAPRTSSPSPCPNRAGPPAPS